MHKPVSVIVGVVATGLLSACAGALLSVDLDQAAADIAQASFQDRGQAKTSRLAQDEANRACSAADVAGQPIDAQAAQSIQNSNLQTVPSPSLAVYLGDWKSGEKIAQNGRGLTWTDKAGSENGGNCYNCHQISKQELSYGTLGPSLYNYGKLRGVKDPASPAAQAVVAYTWGKLWNARAFNACSIMPRFGHSGILSEQQIKDVMALLLDPNSPVNQ